MKTQMQTIWQQHNRYTKREVLDTMWKLQTNPFAGDVINSYNNGPLNDNPAESPFYELETSSPAAFLNPLDTIVHYHSTIHFTGNKPQLDSITKTLLGVAIDEIEKSLQ